MNIFFQCLAAIITFFLINQVYTSVKYAILGKLYPNRYSTAIVGGIPGGPLPEKEEQLQKYDKEALQKILVQKASHLIWPISRDISGTHNSGKLQVIGRCVAALNVAANYTEYTKEYLISEILDFQDTTVEYAT